MDQRTWTSYEQLARKQLNEIALLVQSERDQVLKSLIKRMMENGERKYSKAVKARGNDRGYLL